MFGDIIYYNINTKITESFKKRIDYLCDEKKLNKNLLYELFIRISLNHLDELKLSNDKFAPYERVSISFSINDSLENKLSSLSEEYHVSLELLSNYLLRIGFNYYSQIKEFKLTNMCTDKEIVDLITYIKLLFEDGFNVNEISEITGISTHDILDLFQIMDINTYS